MGVLQPPHKQVGLGTLLQTGKWFHSAPMGLEFVLETETRAEKHGEGERRKEKDDGNMIIEPWLSQGLLGCRRCGEVSRDESVRMGSWSWQSWS